MLKFLREPRRRRIIEAHRLAAAFVPWLDEVALTLGAIAVEVEDHRWAELAVAFERFSDELRRLR